MVDLIKKIAGELKLEEYQVSNSVRLLFNEECTIPFIARYRKEMTGTLDEVALRDIRERYNYLTELESNKVKYIKVVEEHCSNDPKLKGKFPELKKKFEACETKQALEDLYLPFKPKRRTKAQAAKEMGLEPLLEKLLEGQSSITDLLAIAEEYITKDPSKVDPKLVVKTAADALNGAADILSERLSETAELRSLVREISFRTGTLSAQKSALVLALEKGEKLETGGQSPTQSKSSLDLKAASKYENYYEYSEAISEAAPHRVMAVRRGESEKVLRVNIVVDTDEILSGLKAAVMGENTYTEEMRAWVVSVIENCYKRNLAPSIETEIRLFLRTKAEEEAIKVFSSNLHNLLLLPPIPDKVVMGIDPGLRTGSKLAVVSSTGKLLDHTTIYPNPRDPLDAKSQMAGKEISKLLAKHSVEYVAIGNGTGSREIDKLVRDVIKKNKLDHIKRLVVNEAGASVYSTMDIAREEFPDLDPTIRSAVSIARRLQDPLAELVKIDPRSIGVGQYQHDVNTRKLESSLQDVVESAVNHVGVNVNTASASLLGYVSGIGSSLAKNIVSFRNENGAYGSRNMFNKVSGFGPKAFEQAAGFLRVSGSENPLDNSSVHPESYEIVETVAKSINTDVRSMIGDKSLLDSIAWENFVSETTGMPTLLDIAKELNKPGRDPRADGIRLTFNDDVSEIEDLKEGMSLKGTVTNVTNFGAFVDIGVHQDGLVHISQLSDKFVEDPSKVVSVGDVLNVKVLEVDVARRRISLTAKTETKVIPNANTKNPKPQHGASSRKPTSKNRNHQGRNRPSEPAAPAGGFSMNDLLSKFNQ